MSTAAVLTFVVIAGVVWGGFITIVATALRLEGRKREG